MLDGPKWKKFEACLVALNEGNENELGKIIESGKIIEKKSEKSLNKYPRGENMKKNRRKRSHEEVLQDASEISIDEGVPPDTIKKISGICRDDTLEAGGTADDYTHCVLSNLDATIEKLRKNAD